MKRSVLSGIISVTLGMGVWAVAQNGQNQPANKQTPTTAPTTQPFNKKCPVMTDNDVDSKLTVVYEDKVYGFCCKPCIKEFQKNPEKYKDVK